MVYKIRNKAFFLTQSGYKNNYHCKVLNDVTDINPSQTYIIKTHADIHPYIRYFAQYRNTSRKVKQYLYGDKEAENVAILMIQREFTQIWRNETPIKLVQPGPDQRLVGQGDREYELINNNTHPFQLEFYKAQNEHLQQEREEHALREKGEKPLVDQLLEILQFNIKEAKGLKGDDLTSNEYHRIFEDVMTKYYIAMGAEKSRKPNGEFNDFLEVRRPYIEPGVTNAPTKVD